MDAASLFRPRWLLSAVTAALVVVVGLMLSQTAHASQPGPVPQCIFEFAAVCISLDPETDSNTTGTNHTVTATVTVDDEPFPPEASDGEVEVAIIIFQGPNTYHDPDNLDALTTGAINANGQLSLTYVGDGGPGTDTIGAVGCVEELFVGAGVSEASGVQGTLCGEAIGPFIDLCVVDPEECLLALTASEGVCALEGFVFCDVATKDWVEPTPTLAPSATPTVTPTAAPAAALPSTGGDPTDSSAFPLVGAIALVLGAVAILGSGAAIVRRTR